MSITPQDILTFWFEEHGPEDWWQTNLDFDREIIERFSSLHKAATAGECFDWRKTAEGRLAEIIILDQFSRQIYRGLGQAFATDAMALVLAQEAVAQGADQALDTTKRPFSLYALYAFRISSHP